VEVLLFVSGVFCFVVSWIVGWIRRESEGRGGGCGKVVVCLGNGR
jgi:hypothetical protein